MRGGDEHLATIITDFSEEPVRAVDKPQSVEKTRHKGKKPPQRRNRKPIGGKKQKKTKSALADLKKIDHQRGSPKAKQQTDITTKARSEVYRRAEGHCEHCGQIVPENSGGSVAHLNQRSNLGAGWAPWNLILACRTCHAWMDGTAEGRKWSIAKIGHLQPLYQLKDWRPKTHANYRPPRIT